MNTAPATDATFVNHVANDPTVKPWIAGGAGLDRIDLSLVVADRRSHVLVGRWGYSIFRELQSPHIYDWNAAVLEPGRGRWALGAAKASLHWLFSRMPATIVIAAVPRTNRGARQIVAAISGFGLYMSFRPAGR